MKIKLPSIQKINKTWIILAVALGIGVIAALATRSYLSTQIEAIEARGKHETVEVVVAKTEIEKGTVLSTKNLAVRNIPIEYAHSAAVKPEDFERIDGQIIGYKIKAGEMMMWSLMESKKMPTFSARVAVGRRAITVAVDEINSISGMLEPGDLIDLMFTVEQNGKKVILPLLQSIQVMATGQRSADDPKSGERVQFATVTLNTTPEQAKNVIIARETGKLTALLRNPEDRQAIGSKSYDLSALRGAPGPVRHTSSYTAYPGVPVLYGGSGHLFPPEALRLGPDRKSGALLASPPAVSSAVSIQAPSTAPFALK